MECPNCGHILAENDAFCSNCGQYALPLQNMDRSVPVIEPPDTHPDGSAIASEDTVPESTDAPAKRPKKVAARLYPLPDPEPEDALPPEPEEPEDFPAAPMPDPGLSRKQRKTIERLRVLAVVLAIIAVVSAAVAIYTVVSTASLQVQLNKAQRESLTAQSSAQGLEEQVTTLTQDLATAQTERDSLVQQIADLTGQIGTLETSVNQTQYDKESAERSLEDIQTQLETLREEKSTLESQLATAQVDLETAQSDLKNAQADLADAQAENASLSQQLTSLQTKAQFYDDYVVFVMVGSTNNLYHKYSCPNFTGTNFLAYSTRLAEANGYSPCPTCIG